LNGRSVVSFSFPEKETARRGREHLVEFAQRAQLYLVIRDSITPSPPNLKQNEPYEIRLVLLDLGEMFGN
jgi:hypothetical protein